MKQVDERRCAFYCCLVFLYGEDRYIAVQETCPGLLAYAPAGKGGFGYDPLVFLPELGRTVAELSPGEKNRVSHRGRAGRAMAAMLEALEKNLEKSIKRASILVARQVGGHKKNAPKWRVSFFESTGTVLFSLLGLDTVLRLKRSMRPAVSTSFCLPVKKGWQAEQISTCKFFTVERVSMTLPQAQVMVECSYLGWIPCFISSSTASY
jgi:hypothetical protein